MYESHRTETEMDTHVVPCLSVHMFYPVCSNTFCTQFVRAHICRALFVRIHVVPCLFVHILYLFVRTHICRALFVRTHVVHCLFVHISYMFVRTHACKLFVRTHVQRLFVHVERTPFRRHIYNRLDRWWSDERVLNTKIAITSLSFSASISHTHTYAHISQWSPQGSGKRVKECTELALLKGRDNS